MKLKQLLKSIGSYRTYSNLEDFEVAGISCNSKNIKDNFVFIAIKGTCEDGHKFIQEAIEKGAKVIIVQSSKFLPVPARPAGGRQAGKVQSSNKAFFILVEDTRKALAKLAAEFYGNPSGKIRVIGVTGTNGKTTITYLLEAILKDAGAMPAVIGTINYRFKDKVIPSKNTTPGPVELESMLADMLNQGANYAVMEVSSHALDQNRAEGINFHSAIFTNLTQDHLDYHKTLENYFQTKTKLFRDINSKSFAVINNDNEYGRKLQELTRAQVVTYGIDNSADIAASDIKFDLAHTEFSLITRKDKIKLKTRLIGRYNIYNILATVAWGLKEGLDLSIIKSTIENFSLVPGRLERINFAGNFAVFVDYAHTEDALRNVIQALRQLTKNRVIVVFGCGGQRDKTKRPKMGYCVTELADYAIITSDNPRSEEPKEIIANIERGIKKDNYLVIPERFEAIKKSLSMLESGDILLIAGKGHENYQILKDKVMPFDDREVVRECLRSMSY